MTGVEVVTVWAPRPQHVKWRKDYIGLMTLQSRTTRTFENQHHTIVTDDPSIVAQFAHSRVLVTRLPKELMPAMIAGVVHRLKLPCNHHLIFADVDVLIHRSLSEAFDGSFDVGLTSRDNPVAPINNGVMYVDNKGVTGALKFFNKALAVCKNHWGGDQEAISEIAAPVPAEYTIEEREWGRLAFLNMRMYACVPKTRGEPHRAPEPFAVHFKGDTKEWAREYAKKFILIK